ncbi:MAG: sortase [Candidatus Dojkabacteria bacterium]
MKKVLKTFANINILIGIILMIIPIAFLSFINFAPKAETNVFEAQKEDKILSTAIFAQSDVKPTPKYTFKDPFTATVVNETKVKPLQFVVGNTVTTTGATVQVSGIKINTTIYESTNQEAALAAGVWRDPNYGTPDNNELPIVLAAHRWGENNISWDWRNANLFTEFDQLKGGEIVTINWNGKQYRYQVNAIETSNHVSKLADLIMYTCIDYYSPERIIVYATLIR